MSGAPLAGGDGEPLRAAFLHAAGEERERYEREILERGLPLPLWHRTAWARIDSAAAPWFAAVLGGSGRCRYGFAVRTARSRALPAYLLMRVERLDPALDWDACAVALGALAHTARRRWPRVLRVSVELCSLRAEGRARAGERLRELGFRRAERMRMYRHTGIVDLTGDEEAVFARLHRSARRNVRVVMKGDVEIRMITDAGFAQGVERLAREAFARTGGNYPPQDWEAIIELSGREPDLSRVAGLFRRGADGPDGLLAFDWCCMHGDHAQSVAAGSTRGPDARVPLAYALLWDAMRWARARGGRYLDLGGITTGRYGSDDRLGGISDFKRSLGATVVEVGEEWTLEPHAVAARLAAAASRVASLTRRRRHAPGP